MKRLKASITIFLLALWVPLPSHSLLERLEFIHVFAEGDKHEHEADHDVADRICRTESFNSLPAKPQRTELSLVFLCGLPEKADAQHGFDFRAKPAPPGLPVCWQFVCRAAFPARAPSLS